MRIFVISSLVCYDPAPFAGRFTHTSQFKFV